MIHDILRLLHVDIFILSLTFNMLKCFMVNTNQPCIALLNKCGLCVGQLIYLDTPCLYYCVRGLVVDQNFHIRTGGNTLH